MSLLAKTLIQVIPGVRANPSLELHYITVAKEFATSPCLVPLTMIRKSPEDSAVFKPPLFCKSWNSGDVHGSWNAAGVDLDIGWVDCVKG